MTLSVSFTERRVILMRIKHHYNIISSKKIYDFIEKYDIQYDKYYLHDDEYYSFDVFEDEIIYKKLRIHFPIESIDLIPEMVFSAEEIETAEWYTISSNGAKVNWEFEEDSFRRTCPYKKLWFKDLYYRHTEQISFLHASKTINWGSRQFFTGPNSSDDYLFCSMRTKELLEKEKWGGLEIWPVKELGSDKEIKNLFQIVFSTQIPVKGIFGTHKKCHQCGKEIVLTKDPYRYPLEISRDSLCDQNYVYTTGDVLIRDRIHNETYSRNIVSNKFYRYLKEKNMSRGLIFEPVILV